MFLDHRHLSAVTGGNRRVNRGHDILQGPADDLRGVWTHRSNLCVDQGWDARCGMRQCVFCFACLREEKPSYGSGQWQGLGRLGGVILDAR